MRPKCPKHHQNDPKNDTNDSKNHCELSALSSSCTAEDKYLTRASALPLFDSDCPLQSRRWMQLFVAPLHSPWNPVCPSTDINISSSTIWPFISRLPYPAPLGGSSRLKIPHFGLIWLYNLMTLGSIPSHLVTSTEGSRVPKWAQNGPKKHPPGPICPISNSSKSCKKWIWTITKINLHCYWMFLNDTNPSDCQSHDPNDEKNLCLLL